MWLWAQILDSSGQQSSAVAVIDSLLNELHFLRHSLPGVLGAWYRENSPALFDYCLDLQLRSSGKPGGANGFASLLALTKIRYIESYSDLLLAPDRGPESTRDLRLQLAQRANAATGPVPQALVTNINRELEKVRLPFTQKFAYLSTAGLDRYLRSLENDECLLSYHITPTTAQVWIGIRGRVERRAIKNPAETFAALQQARQQLASVGGSAFDRIMDNLGERLLDPVEDLLANTIYLTAAGSLLGFPFDALRVNGYHMLERHTVINLASLPVNPQPAASLKMRAFENIFIAGYPQDYSGAFATRLDTSPEIRAVADIFIGPGLHIVQGVALLPDEFQDGYFQQADLLHLSMPGVIDLRDPEQSSLQLSGDEYSPGGVLLTTADFLSTELTASSVFLSSVRMEGRPLSDFSGRAGFITVFLGAGARSVVTNTWGKGGATAEELITDFYRKLESTGNVANAFREARLQYLKDNHETGLHDWAGYQLFIN
jgi:CHAT domain-containing protein